jgi:hypothetical protein
MLIARYETQRLGPVPPTEVLILEEKKRSVSFEDERYGDGDDFLVVKGGRVEDIEESESRAPGGVTFYGAVLELGFRHVSRGRKAQTFLRWSDSASSFSFGYVRGYAPGKSALFSMKLFGLLICQHRDIASPEPWPQNTLPQPLQAREGQVSEVCLPPL